ncbi:alpha/beta hydrolase fold domain-containing protein [Nocardioides zeae]
MSWQMTAIGALMRVTRKRSFADPEGGAALLARPKGSPVPPPAVARRVDVATEVVDGFDVYSLVRRGTPVGQRPVVVYLHGGAYVNEIVKQHWHLVARIADELDVEVQVPIYGLAPDHDAAEARALVATVLQRLVAGGRAAYLMGDSAGGGLALIAAQDEVERATASAGARPSTLRGLTLIAPWLDLSMANPAVDAVERVDPWLARAALREVARVWAAGTPLDDPTVSPLFRSTEGLPRVELWVGTRDVTQPDCRLLAQHLAGTGEVGYHEVEGAIHVFPILPVPEGRRAVAEILGHVARDLGVAPPHRS